MIAKSTQRALILAIAAALVLPAGGATLSGCGDDTSSANKKKQAKNNRRNRGGGGGGRGGRGKKGKELDTYPKVPDDYRRDFKDADFRPDPTGEKNRSPFRSYVIQQPGTELEEKSVAIEPTDICDADNTSAPTYSLRDLKLIGIVLRGTRAWAQFRDSSGVGHIVRRGDCLGQERAVVARIGAGYVRLEVTPEAPAEGAAPPPQRHDVALYPEELELDETEEAKAADTN